MRKALIAGALVSSVILCGCASKSYVRKQVTPLIDSLNELDQRTAENTKDIKDADTRAEQSIVAANSSTEQVGQKATEAGTQAQQAEDLANTSNAKASSLADTVSNL